MMLHEPAQIFSGERAVGDNADVTRSIANLPGFADQLAGRQQFAVEYREIATAPHAFLKDRSKCEWIEQQFTKLGLPMNGKRIWMPQAEQLGLGRRFFPGNDRTHDISRSASLVAPSEST